MWCWRHGYGCGIELASGLGLGMGVIVGHGGSFLSHCGLPRVKRPHFTFPALPKAHTKVNIVLRMSYGVEGKATWVESSAEGIASNYSKHSKLGKRKQIKHPTQQRYNAGSLTLNIGRILPAWGGRPESGSSRVASPPCRPSSTHKNQRKQPHRGADLLIAGTMASPLPADPIQKRAQWEGAGNIHS